MRSVKHVFHYNAQVIGVRDLPLGAIRIGSRVTFDDNRHEYVVASTLTDLTDQPDRDRGTVLPPGGVSIILTS